MSAIGTVDLGDSVTLTATCHDKNGIATTPASAPTYTIYAHDLSAAMSNGTGTGSAVTSAVTGWYYATHSITAANGYAAGKVYPVLWSWADGSTTYTHENRFHVI